jgi:hypothetical protein
MLVVSLAGCSSQTTSLDDYELFFRFRANGSLVEFTTLADVYGVFVGSACSDRESLEIVAWDSSSRLGLRVSSHEGFGSGTYSIAQRAEDPEFRMLLYFRAPEGVDYFAEPVVPEDATIVISQVGPSTIDGTFFGVVRAAGLPDVIITDGEFSVRREHDLQVPC